MARVWAVALTLLTSAGARAAFDPQDRGWEGISAFVELARAEVGTARVRPIATLDYSSLQPGDAVLFLHPEVEIRFHPVAAFLAAGGRVAVIDDHGKGAPLLERFHIRRANAPSLPALRLRDNSNLAIALPVGPDSSSNALSDHPTLRGVDQVVTNHPTALRLEEGIELTRLLTLPARGEPDGLLAVTGVIGDARACGLVPGSAETAPRGRCGRLFAMGDPSAFINLMLRYPGNHNFARGVVAYLLEDDTWGRRGGNLYVLAGDFRQMGTYGGNGSWRETLGEQQAALLDWLDDVRNNGLPEPVAIALAAITAIGVAIWAGLAGGQLYSAVAPGYSRPIPVVAQGGAAGRAAVLAAPSSDRSLIVLELKRALETTLRQRLRLSVGATPAAIVASAVQRNALGPQSTRALQGLLARLSAGEVAVMNARRLSVSDRALSALHQGVLDILTEVKDQEDVQGDRRAQH